MEWLHIGRSLTMNETGEQTPSSTPEFESAYQAEVDLRLRANPDGGQGWATPW